MAPPDDYLQRVYAGVLGKLIGVYMGRPFEGWTHQRIMAELGHIRYFVNDRFDTPVVVTDDDVSGTFTFIRALEEHPEKGKRIRSEDIGKTWLNNVIKDRTIFWWGGNGVSTEHTAFLNLKRGIKAPKSGSAKVNGRTVAEQIGAQIFIDGWAMVSPKFPNLAAWLAHEAGHVSHDRESVYAAMMWAAMEAQAFVSNDVDHLLDTGLRCVSHVSLIAKLVGDVRRWCAEDGDWMKTRQRIEDTYGYDKFPGFCHVVPNHGVMIMSLIYGGHDFAEAMHIVNTCGWDTDCNSGNVGCLVAIMHGLAAFDSKTSEGGADRRLDWRGPLADRALISSADGGYSINNAARIAYDIVNMRQRICREAPLEPPKDGAQFHFSLPGSVQGFRAVPEELATVVQKIDEDNNNSPVLSISISGHATDGNIRVVEVTTDTFAPPEVRKMSTYELVGSPLVYPGQTLQALVRANKTNSQPILVSLLFKAYNRGDELETFVGDALSIAPSESQILKWSLPKNLGCWPIQAVGLGIFSQDSGDSLLALDYLRWDGTPTLALEPFDQRQGPRTFYKQSFVNSADNFDMSNGKFVLAHDEGEGMAIYGTREWTDYRVFFDDFAVNLGDAAGVAVRVRGLNRYYALVFLSDEDGNRGVALVKALDEDRFTMDMADFAWAYDVPYTIILNVQGPYLRAQVGDVGDVMLSAHDNQYPGGGIGLLVCSGSVLSGTIEVGPSRILLEGEEEEKETDVSVED
ncbi:ADP-ribosylglycohydrolase [Hypoxylon sp. FL0543]|nr:ADP-ribosylglycohydrolase [Hypoxylon sp. FL0543]